MSAFTDYRDADARQAMVDYVARYRFIDKQSAERELSCLNHIGLAYVYRDMLEAEISRTRTLAEYDPLRG